MMIDGKWVENITCPGCRFRHPSSISCGEAAKQAEQQRVASDVTEIHDTLAERSLRYGTYRIQAGIAQGLKRELAATPNWADLDPDKREALEMIVSKIARILNGDSSYVDSWHDIAGYAQLIENRLLGKEI